MMAPARWMMVLENTTVFFSDLQTVRELGVREGAEVWEKGGKEKEYGILSGVVM